MNHAAAGQVVGVAGLLTLAVVADVGAGAAIEPNLGSHLSLTQDFSSQACQSCGLDSTTKSKWSKADLGCSIAYPESPWKEQDWTKKKYWCVYGAFPLQYGWAYICFASDPWFPYYCVPNEIVPTCPGGDCDYAGEV